MGEAPFQLVETYHRWEQLRFFDAHDDPYYDLTVEVDVTGALEFARPHGYSSYFTLCWLWTKALASVRDFRYRFHGDRLVLYDNLQLSAAIPVDGSPYGFARFGWNPDIHEANRTALETMERVRRGGSLGGGPLPPNYVFFSALPKVAFLSLSHVRPNGRRDGEPRVSFGRFQRRNGRVWAPVGMLVNHVFIDGGALGEAIERARQLLSDPLATLPEERDE